MTRSTLPRVFALLIALLFTDSLAHAQTPAYSKCCGTASTQFPFKSTGARKTQLWYNPGDFTTLPPNGNITRLYFRSLTGGQSGVYDDFNILLSQPAGNGFTGTNFETGLTNVHNSPNITINGAAAANGWYFIDLHTPFVYDNTKALVVEVNYSSATIGGGGGLDNTGTAATTPPNKKLYAATITATTGSTSNGFWQDFGFDIMTGPPCPPPTSATATNILSNSATVSWPTVASSTGYDYIVDQNATYTTGTLTTTPAITHNLTGLTPSTTYYLHVRNRCSATNFSPWVDYMFTTLPPCDKPNGFNITNLLPTAATINWDPLLSALSWDYIVDHQRTDPTTTAGATNVTSPTDNVTGLTGNTWYFVHIRANCTGEQSDWSLDSFLTPIDCRAPEVKISNVSVDEAVAYWEAIPSAFEYEYAISGYATPPAVGTRYIHTSLHTPVLKDGKDYYVHVRAKCNSLGTISFSPWATNSFRTWPTGIQPVNSNGVNIEVYPNPASDVLTVEIAGKMSANAHFTLSDITGRILHSQAVSDIKTTINIATLPAGNYLLKYNGGANNRVIKVTRN